MDILKAPASHVVAFSLDGKVTETDIEQVTAQLDQALENNERVNLVIDLTRVSGITPMAALKDVLYGLSTLPRLYRFQRMGVITDNANVETVVKVEARIFSSVDIKSFPSTGLDQAMSWAEARMELPPSGLTIQLDEEKNIFRVEVGDEVSGYDVRAVSKQIRVQYQERGPVGMLLTMGKMPRFGPGLYYEKLKALDVAPMMVKLAVIGPDWLRTWVATAGSVINTRMKHFAMGQQAQALAWLEDETPAIMSLPTLSPQLLVLRASGKLNDREIANIYHLILPQLRGENEVDVLLELPYYEGMTLKAWLQAMKLGIKHFKEVTRGIRRFAVITDSRWLSKAVDLENLLIPGVEERPFSFNQRSIAVSWLLEGREDVALLTDGQISQPSPS